MRKLIAATATAIVLLSGCVETEAPTTTTTEASASPVMGEWVSVGDLDLLVESHEVYDATRDNQFNDANYRVGITATNARGPADEVYDLSPISSFDLVDSSGQVHDTGWGCAGCPDEVESVGLTHGASITGWLYFELPEGRTASELILSLRSVSQSRRTLVVVASQLIVDVFGCFSSCGVCGAWC